MSDRAFMLLTEYLIIPAYSNPLRKVIIRSASIWIICQIAMHHFHSGAFDGFPMSISFRHHIHHGDLSVRYCH